MPKHEPRNWCDAKVEEELRTVAAQLGSFPTASELRSMGRNDLTCAVTKFGGLIYWAERLGMQRKHSDSDTGWNGEKAFQAMVESQGMACERSTAVKAPYDLLIESVVRIDVKTASFASYGQSTGWFYRLGKAVQADLVVFYQPDTGDFYAVPWHQCPTGNVTLSRGGGKYASYLNNWALIRQLVASRKAELKSA